MDLRFSDEDERFRTDLRVWLDGLREDLTNMTGREEPGDDLRDRVARVADGAT